MKHYRFMYRLCTAGMIACLLTGITACSRADHNKEEEIQVTTEELKVDHDTSQEEITTEARADIDPAPEQASTEVVEDLVKKTISWDENWEYADYSKIHSSDVILYPSKAKIRKNITIAVNAGHGTDGGESVKTKCHPDGSPKVTGGTTSEGATESMSISGGMNFTDGTEERDATLSLALILKDQLLEEGFDVLMLREEKDTQLDNIARTVFANNWADYHVSLHYDSTESDKGFFYISVPQYDAYLSMEPVASHWKEHDHLGDSILEGMREEGVSIFSDGYMALDLTQTSFSTIPSVDLEVGDAASDHGQETQSKIASGIVRGLTHLVEEEKN